MILPHIYYFIFDISGSGRDRNVGFQVLTAASMKMAVFWVVAPDYRLQTTVPNYTAPSFEIERVMSSILTSASNIEYKNIV
jgi:translation initiation factor 2 alpha subunit (eIF-2alpha)